MLLFAGSTVCCTVGCISVAVAGLSVYDQTRLLTIALLLYLLVFIDVLYVHLRIDCSQALVEHLNAAVSWLVEVA